MTHAMTAKELEVANKYNLRPSEARILVVLCEFPDYAPHWAIHENDNARKVHISTLRRKLRPHGVAIRCVGRYDSHGTLGYRLERAA